MKFLFFLIMIFEYNISVQVDDEIGSKGYCKNHQSSVLCSKTASIITLILTILVFLGCLLFVILCIRNLIIYRRQRNNAINEAERKELLIKQKLTYLFTKEIKPFNFSLEKPILEENCPVCLEKFDSKKQICITPCKHYYHYYCLSKYAFETKDILCPLCKFNYLSILDNKNINFSKIEPNLIYVDHPLENHHLSSQNNFVNNENNEIQN